jgi:hypothetical protein
MMTQSEFQRIEALLCVCVTNVKRCQEIATRSSALVERAKKLIAVCQKTLKDKEAATLKSVQLSRQSAHASEQLLAAQRNEVSGFTERPLTFVTSSVAQAPVAVNHRARDRDLLR